MRWTRKMQRTSTNSRKKIAGTPGSQSTEYLSNSKSGGFEWSNVPLKEKESRDII